MNREADLSGTVNLHASCVALNGRGLLIIGPSGSGKSALALQLMASGAKLVSDDRTDVTRSNDRLIACSPAVLSGMIEARGVGILHAEPVAEAVAAPVAAATPAAIARLPGATLTTSGSGETAESPASTISYFCAPDITT